MLNITYRITSFKRIMIQQFIQLTLFVIFMKYLPFIFSFILLICLLDFGLINNKIFVSTV